MFCICKYFTLILKTFPVVGYICIRSKNIDIICLIKHMQNSQNIIDTTATASQVLATPTEALATLTQAAEPTQMNTLLQPIINHPIVSSFF
jgi:hypothetical protein